MKTLITNTGYASAPRTLRCCFHCGSETCSN